jgi:hypothetical protein
VGEGNFAMMRPMESLHQPMILRYAVLWHAQVEEPHFDLMVETRTGSDLATWRVAGWPVREQIEATRLRDHRRIYLDYQGEIGGHRGRVERIDGGVCQLEIGEGAVWTLLLSESRTALSLRQRSGDQWTIEPTVKTER